MLIDELEQLRVLRPALDVQNQERTLGWLSHILFQRGTILGYEVIRFFNQNDPLVAKHGNRFQVGHHIAKFRISPAIRVSDRSASSPLAPGIR